MKSSSPFCNKFLSFFLLFVHLGCFFFDSSQTTADQEQQQQLHPPSKRRKISPTSSTPPAPQLTTTTKSHSILAYIKHKLFSLSKFKFNLKRRRNSRHHNYKSVSVAEEQHHSSSHHSAARLLYPCPLCGEILSRRHLLDMHQLTNHSLTELNPEDSGYNVLSIIFQSNWKGQSTPTIHQVLKINNSPRTLDRFEDYRKTVQSRYRQSTDGRCAADGNERLRFYCSTALCSLASGVCRSPYCCTCGIVRHGFSGKNAKQDGIVTYETSWGAHASLPNEVEHEFEFLWVRRTIIVCRVVAGRIENCCGNRDEGVVYDSLVPERRLGGEEELVVYSPMALLPCFVVTYSVCEG